MRMILAVFIGLVALAVAPVEAAPNPDKDNWVQLSAARFFELGDQACELGRHQALRRDWRGDWWWGPCVPNFVLITKHREQCEWWADLGQGKTGSHLSAGGKWIRRCAR